MPICAVCGASVADYLLHLRTDHGVESVMDYERAVQDANRREERVRGFREYVRELSALREAGKITAEEFRARSEEWVNSGKLRRV